MHGGLRDLEHDAHLERGDREGLGLVGHDGELAEERSWAEDEDANSAQGACERRLLDRAAQDDVETLVKLPLAAELLARHEPAQRYPEKKAPQIADGGSGEDRKLGQLTGESVEHPGRLGDGASELQGKHVVRDRVLDL